MNTTRLSPDDPKLTAYALGELDAAEAALVAAAIEVDPAAKAVVDEIRAVAGQLENALENEPIVGDVTAPLAIEASAPSKVVRFPIYWASSLAAACLLIVLASHRQSEKQSLASADTANSSVVMKPVDSGINGSASGAHLSLPVAGMRKRALAPAGTDVNPAPLREDGLKLGRTVAQSSQPGAGSRNQASNTVQSAIRRAESVGPASPHDSTYGGVALQTTGSLRPPQDYSPSLEYGLPRKVSDAPALVYNRESHTFQSGHGFLGVAGFPLSSLAASVPTSSYASLRESLQNGRLPAPGAVRVEEMLNYFSYSYSGPRDGNALAVSVEVAAAPWNPAHRLVRIGLKGRDVAAAEGPATPVAKDVRLEVEFNPQQAKSYRLIGYDNPANKPQEVAASDVKGSDVDAGSAVTALYEVVPKTDSDAKVDGEPLRYDSDNSHLASNDPRRGELLTAKISYKVPMLEASQKIVLPLIDTGAGFNVASKDFKFAAAVASFGMLLKESPHKGPATYDQILTWAQEGQDDKQDKEGARKDFIDLVKKVKDVPVE